MRIRRAVFVALLVSGQSFVRAGDPLTDRFSGDQIHFNTSTDFDQMKNDFQQVPVAQPSLDTAAPDFSDASNAVPPPQQTTNFGGQDFATQSVQSQFDGINASRVDDDHANMRLEFSDPAFKHLDFNAE